MQNIKCYHYIQYDDGKITQEEFIDKFDFEKIGRCIVNCLGELRRHIYEEYEDGTRKEILLADEKLSNLTTSDNGGFYLNYLYLCDNLN